jgi:tetratricopeptide (TPR) repeat protein
MAGSLVVLIAVLCPEHAWGDAAEDFDQLAGKLVLQAGFGFLGMAENTALEMQRLAEGPLHDQPVKLAEAHAWHGYVCTLRGRLSDAESYYMKALAIAEKHLPRDDERWALGWTGLGLLYKEQGRFAEAEPLAAKALEFYQRVRPPDHPHIATALHNLGTLYLLQDRYAEAEPLLKRAQQICQKGLPGRPVQPSRATGGSPVAVRRGPATGRTGIAQRAIGLGPLPQQPGGDLPKTRAV